LKIHLVTNEGFAPAGKQYPGVHGKLVDWAEHVFEEGMMYVRVRFTDKTELRWMLQTAHVLRESDLSDWKTGDCKQLTVYAEKSIGPTDEMSRSQGSSSF
jgi:hypothetical protein